jgi:hypothetical protein
MAKSVHLQYSIAAVIPVLASSADSHLRPAKNAGASLATTEAGRRNITLTEVSSRDGGGNV